MFPQNSLLALEAFFLPSSENCLSNKGFKFIPHCWIFLLKNVVAYFLFAFGLHKVRVKGFLWQSIFPVGSAVHPKRVTTNERKSFFLLQTQKTFLWMKNELQPKRLVELRKEPSLFAFTHVSFRAHNVVSTFQQNKLWTRKERIYQFHFSCFWHNQEEKESI